MLASYYSTADEVWAWITFISILVLLIGVVLDAIGFFARVRDRFSGDTTIVEIEEGRSIKGQPYDEDDRLRFKDPTRGR